MMVLNFTWICLISNSHGKFKPSMRLQNGKVYLSTKRTRKLLTSNTNRLSDEPKKVSPILEEHYERFIHVFVSARDEALTCTFTHLKLQCFPAYLCIKYSHGGAIASDFDIITRIEPSIGRIVIYHRCNFSPQTPQPSRESVFVEDNTLLVRSISVTTGFDKETQFSRSRHVFAN